MKSRRNKHQIQSLVASGTPNGGLVAQEVNNEWCDTTPVHGDQIYLKLTNLEGGPQGENVVKWLDYQVDPADRDGSTFTWSVDPDHMFFMTPSIDPYSSSSANRSYFLMIDRNHEVSKPTWDSWKDTLCKIPNRNQECSGTSNVSNCSIGHRQSKGDYWGVPQTYCETTSGAYTNYDCVNISTDRDTRKSWWGRSPYNSTTNSRRPAFCNAIANVQK